MYIKCQSCDGLFVQELESFSFCLKCVGKNLELCKIILDQYIFENKDGVESFYYKLANSLLEVLVAERPVSEISDFLSGFIHDSVFVEEDNVIAYDTIEIKKLIEKCKDTGINDELLTPFLLTSVFYLYGAETSRLRQNSMINYYVELLRAL
jgi:hypothetical protein